MQAKKKLAAIIHRDCMIYCWRLEERVASLPDGAHSGNDKRQKRAF
jgi:hypothetical protein